MAKALQFLVWCIVIQISPGFGDKLFLSIDCGETYTPFRTNELGIKWVADSDYIKTGKTAKVQVTSTYYPELKSLRYFPSQKKSCYVIPGVAKGRKHMIRAHFFYGNYDGKSSPPSFDLQFDGNYWGSVTTSATVSYYEEVIYAPKRDNISICVAQTSPNHIPFISALAIMEFEPGMYETNSMEAVLLQWVRTAFGAKDSTRYPNDPYDRFWYPSGAIGGVMSVASDNMSFIKNFTLIPALAMAHAITPESSSATTLMVPSTEMRLADALYYFNFYFMEVSKVAALNNSRSFDFLVDGDKINDKPIAPPYQSGFYVYDHVGRNLTAGSVISLVNTPDASLPPILNAMELFTLHTGLASATNENDVNALEALQGQYQQLLSWAGDPCLPVGYTWDWLNCNIDSTPRVIELHLSGSGLKGNLTDFSGLTALEIIDLSNNSLSGQIPLFLGTFPSLKELRAHQTGTTRPPNIVRSRELNSLQINLADNNFSGPLPASLKGNQKINLNITGNNITEDKPLPPIDGGRNTKPIVIGVSVGSVILFLLLVGCVVYARLRIPCPRPSPRAVMKNNAEILGKQQAGSIQPGRSHAFTYKEIVKITSNFGTAIGEGGSSSVYYGRLDNGYEVAVKVLKNLQQRGSKEFVAEVKLLMTVHHKNLVSFVGFCEEGKNMVVLYQYMQNGSLRDLLSGKKTIIEPLTWKKRLQIALDVATGLEYLHSGCEPAIIHRDIKSRNILLDEQLKARLADFGISRTDDMTQASVTVAGTPGYIDPEYNGTGILCKKSDIYSFGVVLFEIMCGPAAIFGGDKQYSHIVPWATSKIVRGDIESIVDPRIEGQYKINSVWKVAETALACTAPRSTERPNMYNILKDLNEAMEMEMDIGY